MDHLWEKIESFIGFGCADAPVVFVGIEEGLQRGADLDRDIRHRSTFDAIMDLKTAHEGIPGTQQFFDPVAPKCQATWRPMCDFMLRRETPDKAPTLAQRSRYQSHRLGRSDGETLLAELLPYPNVGTARWAYEPFGRYGGRNEYEAALLPRRISLLGGVLASAARELIVCYGKSRWIEFEKLIAAAYPEQKPHWSVTDRGGCKTATIAKTRVVLTHHFSTRFFNTESQLARLADVAMALT